MPNFKLMGDSCSPLCQKCPNHGSLRAQTWHSCGPSNWFFLSLNQFFQGYSVQISHGWVHPVAPFARNVQIMAILWPKHGPYTWFLLNLNECAKEYFMPNLTLLGVSNSPLCQKCPNHGHFMAKTCLFLPEYLSMFLGMLHVKFYMAWCILYSPLPGMSKSLPFYGQNMGLIWFFELVLL